MSGSPVRNWLGRAALALFLLGCMVIVIGAVLDSGPIDYRMTGILAGMGVAFGVALALPVLLIRLARRRTVPPMPPRHAGFLVAVGLAAVVAVGVWRGAITPWAPVAARTDAACPALDRAGLDRAWPGVALSRTRDDGNSHDAGVNSYCAWTVDAGSADPPFQTLNSYVYLFNGSALRTPLGWAMDDYRDRRDEALSPRTIEGIGDEAFASDHGDQVIVTARRANVVIVIDIWGPEPGAERVAHDLVRRMAAGVRADR